MKENLADFVKQYADRILEKNKLDPEFYKKFNVKRGLRNSDGTGVLAGLTGIGDVHGYIIDENEVVPVDGRLRYRGIGVNDLVAGFQKEKRFGFEEAVYLLCFGELPTKDEHETFTRILAKKRELPDQFTEDMILKAPSSNIMNKLARSVLASYSYDDNAEDSSFQNVLRQCLELISRFPTFIAYAFQAKRHYFDHESLFIHAPDPKLNTAENFLHMMRSDRQYTALEAEILDLSLVLHAEHGGGNNSSFSIHVVTSAGTDVYSAVAAAVGSLKGVKHGGASLRVIKMMRDIKEHVAHWDNEGEVADYLTKILNKQAFDGSGLVYGMGHAVYTLSDPRAVLLEEKAKALAKEKGRLEELNLYNSVAKLTPELFAKIKGSQKNIAPNVDFYSGFVYSMLGLPEELYTPLFAMARIVGWSAHLMEELRWGGRIIRPAYKHVVPPKEYLPIAKR